jgi:L-cysteine desulfidase
VIFKQTKEIRSQNDLLKIVHKHAENLTTENKAYQDDNRKAKEELEEKLQELKSQFLKEKITLIERVSEEMHRLRCLS